MIDIVGHFDEGYTLLVDYVEVKEIVELNLLAGQKAKASTTYESAVKYLTVAIELLKKLNKGTYHQLTVLSKRTGLSHSIMGWEKNVSHLITYPI